MKTPTRWIVAAGLLSFVFFSRGALAAEPVKIQIQVKPVENQQALYKLMIQNSLRIYRQRLRFFEEAAREQKKLEQARNQFRHRYQHRVRTGSPQYQAGLKADDPAARSEAGKNGPAENKAVAAQHRHRHRIQVARKADASGRQLKNLLRKKRLSQSAALDRKLRNRLKKQARTRTRTRVEAGTGAQHRHGTSGAQQRGRR